MTGWVALGCRAHYRTVGRQDLNALTPNLRLQGSEQGTVELDDDRLNIIQGHDTSGAEQ